MTLRITTVFRGVSYAPRCGGEDWSQRSCTDDEGSVSPHGCLGPQKKGPSSGAPWTRVHGVALSSSGKKKIESLLPAIRAHARRPIFKHHVAQTSCSSDKSFSAADLEVVTTKRWNERGRNVPANVGTFQMLAVLVLMSIFAAGFCCGYGVRAWRSKRRSARYRLYAPYTPAAMETGRSQPPS